MLILILIMEEKKKKAVTAEALKRKNRKDGCVMTEAAKQLIGKKCYVESINGGCTGILREVTGNALVVECKKDKVVVNLDFVLRIRELPEKKK